MGIAAGGGLKERKPEREAQQGLGAAQVQSARDASAGKCGGDAAEQRTADAAPEGQQLMQESLL